MRRTPRKLIARSASLAAGLIAMGTVALADDGKLSVEIRDYKFNPPEVKVKVGTSVTWINGEKRTSHSVLFLGPDGFESERMFPGESWTRIFDKPGVYTYSCGPHPEMKGRIEVVE